MSKSKSIKTIFRNKKTITFLVFLGFSFIIWLLIKLSKEYEQNYTVTLQFYETDKQKIISDQSLEKVNVLVKSTGFQLLRHNLSSKEFNIDVTNLGEHKITVDLSNSRYKNALERQLFKRSNVLAVTPESVSIQIDTLKSKRLLVKPLIQLIYKNGYQLKGAIAVEPKFITAYGPSEILDSISIVNTDYKSIENVYKDFSFTIALATPPSGDISYSENEVKLSGIVERFSEKEISLPVRFINVPKNITIKPFPEKIKVLCKGSLNNLKTLSTNDFDLVCDYTAIDSTSTFAKTFIRSKPDNIEILEINDSNFQVLMRKK
ncbi:hypothetical protein NBRC110019_09200 [Neptunitalea chrysea]|uniref:YbbR-like protein n=1 Tax=Neptunitalea chrysea TaxID=1647581 RepID=A0A9W6B3M4_9FLAO|nr:YbbR-like domain-containing protein [Neptunitalea chrysea]GLB51881.1 hypothetical protein NBRC110019_09200 [Neptunitalea chrysea]